ncbi:MAG: ribonuclease H-like domain-containing protein [Sphingomonadales bacterium]
MTHTLHRGDLPDDLVFTGDVAIDTETMGLNPLRDRLCLVQLSGGDGAAHLVQIAPGQREAPNLKRLLEDPSRVKIFHYARFDIATLRHHLGIETAPLYCTKIVSKLVRTYTDRHGLRDLCKEMTGIEISKQQQSSDWGAHDLSEAQLHYAAADVLYLHRIREALDAMLARTGRQAVAEACFGFLPVRATLDLAGWPEEDIFAH